jgi:hypothetical protein
MKNTEHETKNIGKDEKSTKPFQLSKEQKAELMSYPDYWRPILRSAAEKGESIKKVFQELKDLDSFT